MGKSLYIKDLYVGQVIDEEYFGLYDFKFAQDKNGKTYADIVLGDKTGRLQAKLWSENLAKYDTSEFQLGKVCSVSAVVQEYRGSMQLSINHLKFLSAADYIQEDYQEASLIPSSTLEKTIQSYISNVLDNDIKKLLDSLFFKYKKQFLSFPAAKTNHHHYLGGLAEHICEMLDIAAALKKYYPEADMSLITAGCILHDIGKFIEFGSTGFATEYTDAGKLIGHISLGVEIIDKHIQQTKGLEQLQGSQKLLLLKHIILSHHGKQEFGSPVTPKTLEAAMVSAIDDLSFKSRAFQKVIVESSQLKVDASFSKREYSIDTEVYLRSSKHMNNVNEKGESEKDFQQKLIDL